MSSAPPPYTSKFDLAPLTERSTEVTLAPSPNERAAIASWLGVLSVENLEAVIRIARAGDNHYSYDAEFAAGVTQACVITLEPVSSHLEGEFKRSFLVTPRSPALRRQMIEQSRSHKVELTASDEEEPELLDGYELDLAAPVLEELALSLDPYPRAPGAELPAVTDAEPAKESPFAVLGKLKAEGAQDAPKRGKSGGRNVRGAKGKA